MYAVTRHLDPDTYLDFARAVYAEMALAGITAVGEFHYVHHAPGGRRYDDPNAMGRTLIQAADEAGIRITLLAMVLPQTPGGAPFLPWQELPEANPQHASADEQLRQSLATLGQASLIDLFNIVRFPKSNIVASGRILESLRDRGS